MSFELARQDLDSLLLQRSLLLLGQLLRDLHSFLAHHCILTLRNADRVRGFNLECFGESGASRRCYHSLVLRGLQVQGLLLLFLVICGGCGLLRRLRGSGLLASLETGLEHTFIRIELLRHRL